jgi:hypothetical protein
MSEIDFNNKTFSLISNAGNGAVNSETVFEYSQNGNLVTADYYGGTIKYGKIIAILKDNQLDMLYQCITTDNKLKAGKAMAEISIAENEKIKLRLNWKWLDRNEGTGISEYIEN